MVTTPDAAPHRPIRVLGALGRHAFIVMVTTLLAVGLGFAYLASQSYTAESVILLRPVPGNPLSPESAEASANQNTIAMGTESELVSTPRVQALASERVGTEVPTAGDTLNVEKPDATQTLRIQYSSSSPERAQARAQGFAEAFLDYRRGVGEKQQGDRLRELREQASDARTTLRKVSGRKNAFLQEQAEILSGRLAELSAAISAEQIVNTEPGEVVREAEAPAQPGDLPPTLVLVAAGLAGLFLGGCAALWREWQQDRVRTSHLESLAGLPVLTTVRRRRARTAEGTDNESVGRLRAGMVALCPAPSVLALAPIRTGLDVGGLGYELTRSLTSAGYSALFIDTDTSDSPSAEEVPGLAEVLTGSHTLEGVVSQDGLLGVLGAGQDPGAVRELAASTTFRRVIDQCHRQYDYVVIGTARAGSAAGDASMTAVDSAILVMRDGRSTHEEVADAVQHLKVRAIQPVALVGLRFRRLRLRRRRTPATPQDRP